MILSVLGSGFLTEPFNITSVGGLTDITPTNIGKRPVVIASVTVTEVSNGTPNLTLIVYDPKGLVSYYRRNAKPMAAKETFVDAEPFVLNQGWTLQVQVSSGSASVFVNYLNPNAAGVQS